MKILMKVMHLLFSINREPTNLHDSDLSVFSCFAHLSSVMFPLLGIRYFPLYDTVDSSMFALSNSFSADTCEI